MGTRRDFSRSFTRSTIWRAMRGSSSRILRFWAHRTQFALLVGLVVIGLPAEAKVAPKGSFGPELTGGFRRFDLIQLAEGRHENLENCGYGGIRLLYNVSSVFAIEPSVLLGGAQTRAKKYESWEGQSGVDIQMATVVLPSLDFVIQHGSGQTIAPFAVIGVGLRYYTLGTDNTVASPNNYYHVVTVLESADYKGNQPEGFRLDLSINGGFGAKFQLARPTPSSRVGLRVDARMAWTPRLTDEGWQGVWDHHVDEGGMASWFNLSIGAGVYALFGGERDPFTPRAPKDADGDGVPNPQDDCKWDREDNRDPYPNDGCPDSDSDGVHDGADQCKEQAEDGLAPRIADGCPREVEPEPTDTTQPVEPTGPKDSDGDDFFDDEDECPNEPEDWDGDEDFDGCPD